MSAIAQQARALCGERHQDSPAGCPTCHLLETRLQPVCEALSGILKDAALTLTVDALNNPLWAHRAGCDCTGMHHRWNCPMTPIWAQTMRDLDINPWTVVTGNGHRWRAERAHKSLQRVVDAATRAGWFNLVDRPEHL